MARLDELGLANVHVICGDGSLGLPAHAPYDAIAVAAGGPRVPPALKEQLAIGGRLVMPVGGTEGQELVRVTRVGPDDFEEERLLPVTFVPLIGAEAWPDRRQDRAAAPLSPEGASALVRDRAQPIDLDALLARIGDARVVLLGGAIDGAAEVHRARVRITEALLAKKGFSFVAIDTDFADGARVDEHVRARAPRPGLPLTAFARFPDFRWRSRDLDTFVDALRTFDANAGRRAAGFHALDVYGTSAAVAVALERLEERDPERAADAKARWATLSPWRRDAADVLDGGDAQDLENEIVALLAARLDEVVAEARADGKRVTVAAERAAEQADRYYRHLLRGALDAWSMRTDHVFDMLKALLADYGATSRAVVWTSDAQVADARGMESGVRGHRTLGQLCRAAFGEDAYLLGISADRGQILASPSWSTRPRRTVLRPALPESHEHVLRLASAGPFFLPLRDAPPTFGTPRLARCVGAIYGSDRELANHYLYVSLPAAFDEILFFPEVSPVESVATHPVVDPEEVHPLHG
jgi:protein-L-isoaspartate(D-aspartate) O-methyltransferase